jgi:hypothetical protein
MAALAPEHYLAGRYAAIGRGGQPGIGQDSIANDIANDLTVAGSLAGGSGLQFADLNYVPVPEPKSLMLMCLGIVGVLRVRRHQV